MSSYPSASLPICRRSSPVSNVFRALIDALGSSTLSRQFTLLYFHPICLFFLFCYFNRRPERPCDQAGRLVSRKKALAPLDRYSEAVLEVDELEEVDEEQGPPPQPAREFSEA